MSNLLLDEQNPRLPEPTQGQRATLLEIVRRQSEKIVKLAAHLCEHGPNPTDLLAVTRAEDSGERYLVLDGNRRVAAVKLLENPELAVEALSGSQAKALRRLARRYHKYPFDALYCAILESREQADTWIRLMHRGESGGAGLVPWDGQVAATYDARRGKPAYALQLLDFVRENGELSQPAEQRIGEGKFPITTLKRLISTPYVRHKLGIDKDSRRRTLVRHYPWSCIEPGITRVLEDIATGEITVTDVKLSLHRQEYADSIASAYPLNVEDKLDEPEKLDEPPDVVSTRKKRPPRPRARRQTLIPRSCPLRFDCVRLDDIADELKELNMEKFRNAASVMLRVILELSVDAYLCRIDWADPSKRKGSNLNTKVRVATRELKIAGKLTQNQVDAANRATGSRYLASSIPTLHAYLHNVDFSPGPTDLRTAWDNLQPLVVQIASSLTEEN